MQTFIMFDLFYFFVEPKKGVPFIASGEILD
jgi:hypothetical protein